METPEGIMAEMKATSEEGNALTDELVNEQALEGEFSDAATKALAKAMNLLLPAFGVEEPLATDYELEGGRLPMEMDRYVLAIRDAVNDAIEDDVLDADMAIDLAEINDDTDLRSLTARVRMAAGNKDFKRWLASEVEEQAEEQAEVAVEAASPDVADDALMMSRL